MNEVAEQQSPQASGIEVVETQVKPAEGGPETEVSPGPLQAQTDAEKEAEKARIAHELEVRLQPIMLDAAITGISNLMANLTKMPEMAFNKGEHDALVEAWMPLLPLVSPWTNAILVSIIILGGKGLYYNAHRVKPAAKETAKPDTATAKEGEPRPESDDLKPAE